MGWGCERVEFGRTLPNSPPIVPPLISESYSTFVSSSAGLLVSVSAETKGFILILTSNGFPPSTGLLSVETKALERLPLATTSFTSRQHETNGTQLKYSNCAKIMLLSRLFKTCNDQADKNEAQLKTVFVPVAVYSVYTV